MTELHQSSYFAELSFQLTEILNTTAEKCDLVAARKIAEKLASLTAAASVERKLRAMRLGLGLPNRRSAQILLSLMDHADIVCSHADLANTVGTKSLDVIKVYICNIRTALDSHDLDVIQTDWKRGYRIDRAGRANIMRKIEQLEAA
jgi:DNA-binding response OmpR family regulator